MQELIMKNQDSLKSIKSLLLKEKSAFVHV